MLLSKAEILAQRLPTEKVPVPWIGGGDAGERFLLVRAIASHQVQRAMRMEASDFPDAWVFQQCVVDENGARVFEEKDVAQIADTVDTSLIELVVATAYRLAEVPAERREYIKKKSPSQLTRGSGDTPTAAATRIPT